ncbi:MAG: hypothetical protein ACFFDN_23845, partial [Candidatus Hodarchaeota archaeon]
MFAYADLQPFPNNPHTLWERFAFIWQHDHLGYPLPESSFEVIIEIMICCIGNPTLAQNFLLLLAMPCAIICMYFFLGNFLDKKISRMMASFVYGLNPIIIGRFVNGGPLNILFLYSFLPLLWLQLIKIFYKGKIFDVLLFIIFFGILGSSIHHIIWAIFPFLIFFLFFNLLEKRNRNKEMLLRISLIFFSITVGFLLVLPDIFLIYQRGEILLSEFESLMEAVKWAYSEPTLLNLLRLAGNGGDLMMRSLNYNNNSFFNFFGLIIPLIAFAFSFLIIEKRKYVILFMTIIMSIIIFIILTRFEYTYLLFHIFPILLSLKNPVKLMYPMSLAICSLFGFGLDVINKKKLTIIRSNKQTIIINIAIFVMIFLYLFPVLGGGTVGLNEIYGDSYYIPKDYETIFSWIEDQRKTGEFFRTLWLPYDYTIQIRLRASDPYNIGLRSGAAWLNMPNINFVNDIFDTICKKNTENFSEVLKLLDVKYIIIVPGSKQIGCLVKESRVTPWILGNNLYFSNFIENQKYLKEIFRYNNITIYENKKFVPSHITTYDSLIFLVPPLNEQIFIPSFITPNLLKNPYFEMDAKFWWMDEIYKRAKIDEEISYTGNCSVKIINKDYKIWPSIAQNVRIASDGTYYFSSWIRAEDVCYAHIKIVWFDINEKEIQTDYIINIGEIEGSKDWFHISKILKAPLNATVASIRLIGGLSSDGTTEAITWFDNIEFYEISPTISDLFIPNYLSLLNVYGFDSSKHLVVFEKDLSDNEIMEIINISNIIVFSHPIKSQLIRYMNHLNNQTILQLYEAENLPATGRSLLLNNSMSNGKAIKIINGTLNLEFYAPRSSYYKIGINGLFHNISIFVDNKNISMKNEIETNVKYLYVGNHILNIISEDAIIDQIQILSTTSKDDIDDIFVSNSHLKSRIENIIYMKDHYIVDLELENSALIVLQESYHKNWELCILNKIKVDNLLHFKAFNWANAFYIPKNERMILKIQFKQQA